MARVAVGDIMTRNLVSVSPQASLFECAKQLVKNRVNSLLVVNGKRLIGIVTARDILWVLTKKPNSLLKKMNVMQIATKKVAVIKPSADIQQAFNKMKSLNFKRLPVLSKGEIIGLITLNDILRIEPSVYKDIGELVGIKEESEKLNKTKSSWPIEGLCETCGAFSDLLKIEGKLLCPDCRDELD